MDIAEEDLEEMKEILAELKAEDPDLDFDNVDIVINEDGTIDIYEAEGLTVKQRDKKLTRLMIKRKKKLADKSPSGRRKKLGRDPKKRMKPHEILRMMRQRDRTHTTKNSFDASEVSADDAIAMGEEDSDVQEYTVGKQARPTNAMVYRMVDGKIKKVKRWTKKGKKDINKGPKSSAHKDAISRAMKVSWRVGARGRADDDAMDAKSESTDYINALASGEETLSETFNEVETVLEPLDGEIKMAKDMTKKDEKDIGEEPKSVDHKTALSTALKRVWKAREVEGVTTEESYDPTNDVSALLTGEELSEEFKEKATTIFEAAVNNEVDKQLALAEAEVHSVFDSAIDEAKTELTEQLDNYFDYVTDQWFDDNKVAIDTGIRSEIAENFIGGLKTLFTENYVEVPDSKTDVLDELGKQLVELKASLNEQITSNVSLKQELSELKRHEIVQSVSSDLTVTEVEKLKELSEGISFEDSSDFVSKLETIKESYFPTKTVKTVQQEEEQEESFEVLSESMDVYSSALTRTTQS